MAIARLENPIQEYAWGSRSELAEFLGQPSPSPAPQAEIWMGAHESDPSRAVVAGASLSLLDWIAADPRAVLGPAVLQRFGARLPFLFKVLAVAQPLSIQAHPDADQARQGFAREEELGIDRRSAARRYLDRSHKPEILCALTPFRALAGFREPADARQQLRALGVFERLPRLSDLPAGSSVEWRRALLTELLMLPGAEREPLVSHAVARAQDMDGALGWVCELNDAHPGDVGALAPAFLRPLTLAAGEAIFMPPRELHCYVGGSGVELMANSDNVLRGGLTHKAVDVPELLRVLHFGDPSAQIVRAQPDAAGVMLYPTPASEFLLRRWELAPGNRLAEPTGIEIWLCTEGNIRTLDSEGRALQLSRGESCVVPANSGKIELSGSGTLFRASVPL